MAICLTRLRDKPLKRILFQTSALSKPRQEVAVRPDFERKFTDTTVTDGEEVKLTVKVSGTPVPDVEWQKGSKPVRDGRRVKIDKDRDGVHSLRIPRVETADQEEYTCIAKNKAGKATCSAKLTVQGISGCLCSKRVFMTDSFVQRIANDEFMIDHRSYTHN